MDQKQLFYVAGAVMPQNRIRKNDASLNAGFLGSKIYTDQEQALLDSGLVKHIPIYDRVIGKKSQREKEVELSTKFYNGMNFRSEHDREAAARIAERLRLVKGRKSPTGYHRIDNFEQIQRRIHPLITRSYSITELHSLDAHSNFESLYDATERGTPKILNQNGKKAKGEPDIVPVSLQLMQRECFEQYKLQVVTQTPSSRAPEANTGERFSEKLTSGAVTKIFESAAYMAVKNDGFTTFFTPTFTKAQRLAIFGGMADADEVKGIGEHHSIQIRRNMVMAGRSTQRYKKVATPVLDIAGPYSTIPIKGVPSKTMNINGEIVGDYCPLFLKPEKEYTIEKTLDTTIGKELSRWLDGAKKMFQRGWWADYTIQIDEDSGCEYCDLTRRWVPGHIGAPSELGPTNKPLDFHYIWVAECPTNDDGEPNPHAHVLLKWNVDKSLFPAWARRLEKLWGHGFAKLEKIRKPKAAGSYIIKAVGYAAKGGNSEQGLIRGNRYNIARCSRAPKWECLASFDAGNITAVIKELGHKLDQWKKPLRRQISKLHAAKAQTIKAKAIARYQNKSEEYENKLYSRIIRLEKQAQKLNTTIKERGVFASTTNRFCVTFEGEQSAQKLNDFMIWAAGARGWSLSCRDVDMSDLKQYADEQYVKEFNRFQDRRAYWEAVFNDERVFEEFDENNFGYWKNVQWQYTQFDIGTS